MVVVFKYLLYISKTRGQYVINVYSQFTIHNNCLVMHNDKGPIRCACLCHVKALNPTSRPLKGIITLKLGHTVSCFALCSSRFDGFAFYLPILDRAHDSCFRSISHTWTLRSYLPTFAVFKRQQATWSGVQDLGVMEHPNPTPAGCVLMVSNFSCISYISLLCVCQTTLPHVLDQDLKQMLQEFVLVVLMFDFPLISLSFFFLLFLLFANMLRRLKFL